MCSSDLGVTSHAAVIGRGLGLPCVVGAFDMSIDAQKNVVIGRSQQILREGDVITVDGTLGEVLVGLDGARHSWWCKAGRWKVLRTCGCVWWRGGGPQVCYVGRSIFGSGHLGRVSARAEAV